MVRTVVNSGIIDADAWVKKYLVAASLDQGLVLFIIIGIMAGILISNPIHVSSQWELNRVTSTPRFRVI